MPIFDYSCDCGASKTDYMVRKWDNPVHCHKCRSVMKKGIAVPNIHGMDGFGSSNSDGTKSVPLDDFPDDVTNFHGQ